MRHDVAGTLRHDGLVGGDGLVVAVERDQQITPQEVRLGELGRVLEDRVHIDQCGLEVTAHRLQADLRGASEREARGQLERCRKCRDGLVTLALRERGKALVGLEGRPGLRLGQICVGKLGGQLVALAGLHQRLGEQRNDLIGGVARVEGTGELFFGADNPCSR